MTKHILDLANVLARRRMSVERFLENEDITTLSQLDAWLILKVGDFFVSAKLLEELEETLRITVVAPPTPPTPLTKDSLVGPASDYDRGVHVVSLKADPVSDDDVPVGEKENMEEKTPKPKKQKTPPLE